MNPSFLDPASADPHDDEVIPWDGDLTLDMELGGEDGE